MVDITVTATAVIPVAGQTNVFEDGLCLEAIAAGKTVYFDTTLGTYGLYDTNSATAMIRVLRGICVAGGGTGQRIEVQTAGQVTMNAVLTTGRVFVGTGTPGGIALTTDIATGFFTSILGVAISTTVLDLSIKNSGVSAS